VNINDNKTETIQLDLEVMKNSRMSNL